jgi:hypothetical protein
MRRETLRFLLLGVAVALGACSAGPNQVNPTSRLTYACNGADTMVSYSACDRPDHFSDRQQTHHDNRGPGGAEPPVGSDHSR